MNTLEKFMYGMKNIITKRKTDKVLKLQVRAMPIIFYYKVGDEIIIERKIKSAEGERVKEEKDVIAVKDGMSALTASGKRIRLCSQQQGYKIKPTGVHFKEEDIQLSDLAKKILKERNEKVYLPYVPEKGEAQNTSSYFLRQKSSNKKA